MQTSIEGALKSLNGDSRLLQLRDTLAEPNIFYILKMQSMEIRHSNFLAWLLDPRETHGLGDSFLRQFLVVLASSGTKGRTDQLKPSTLRLDNVQVRREWRHIDLLLVFPELVVVIENKVLAGEHGDQLYNYRSEVNRVFGDHCPKCFVLLSPDGKDANIHEAPSWQPLGLSAVVSLAEEILKINAGSLNTRSRFYISDYLDVIRRQALGTDEETRLAQEIYKEHRRALDFIFEKRPERLDEIDEVLRRWIKACGWHQGSTSRGYTRFLTEQLEPLIPCEADWNWDHNESFIFEFYYGGDSILFRTIIPPSRNQKLREVLAAALSEIDHAAKPSSREWMVHFEREFCVDLKSLASDEDVLAKLNEMRPWVTSLVEKVESALSRAASEITEATKSK